MLNNFVNFDFFFTKPSGIDPCEKRINRLGGHAWRNLFMACSKVAAMAIYLVKQARSNDIMPAVYSIVCIKKMQQKVVESKEKNHYQLVTAHALFWVNDPECRSNFCQSSFIFSKIQDSINAIWFFPYFWLYMWLWISCLLKDITFLVQKSQEVTMK